MVTKCEGRSNYYESKDEVVPGETKF